MEAEIEISIDEESPCYNKSESISTDSPASSIKAIDTSTIHRICSGQVVLTLATAVKELVENSLDAGSTCIDIRLLDYGSSLIEVSDNGKGAQPCDFAGLALKHHTSKLENFGDLVSVKTYGFRGEALSSLCALSNLAITTRHSKQMVGSKITYDNNGRLVEEIPISRNVGTTVSLQNIFYTLPVRHKEFIRNLKKEYNKMIQILYSYCLISSNIRISCTNQCEKGKKATIVSTDVHSLMKENISSIFGVKQMSSLLEIKQKSPDIELLSQYGISQPNENGMCSESFFKLEGFISSCAHGLGRSSADRQFYYINNRPCDPAKISRVVNEVYHHYNKNQFPMVVLNIRMNEDDVDINVTPDKRQILVNREKLLLATVKMTLVCLYEHIPSTINVRQIAICNFSSGQNSQTPKRLSSLSEKYSHTPSPNCKLLPSKSMIKNTFSGIKRSLSSVDSQISNERKQPKLQEFFPSNKMEEVVEDENLESTQTIVDDNEELFPSFIQEVAKPHFVSCCSSDKADLRDDQIKCLNESNSDFINKDVKSFNNDKSKFIHLNERLDRVGGETYNPKFKIETFNTDEENNTSNKYSEVYSRTRDFLNSLLSKKANVLSKKESIHENDDFCLKHDKELFKEKIILKSGNPKITSEIYVNEEPTSDDVIIVDTSGPINSVVTLHSLTVQLSLVTLKEKLKTRKERRLKESFLRRKFRATISPADNKSAEEELRKEVSKPMFSEMDIIGQFNLGFIVTRHGSDLFIIDQHATDEKYNFETLQNLNVIQNQKLIIPQQLELTVVNEGILIDNIDIFTKNGFEFSIDENNQLGRRVSTMSIPHSRGWEFGKDDIEEMIFMLSDSPGEFCRPSRFRAMFASRACRKSVMIGTPLSLSEMRKLVDHMGKIEQPWNCPHGRPTMRHLINLDVVSDVHLEVL